MAERSNTAPAKRKAPALIGWRERVGLPELGVRNVVAKIDTGAKSAALHATDIRDAGGKVSFTLPVNGRNHHLELPMKGRKTVRSSSGHAETRAVVETKVKVGKHLLSIEVTLTDRTDMGVPMLLGRSSLGGRFLVHPAKSFILSASPRIKTTS